MSQFARYLRPLPRSRVALLAALLTILAPAGWLQQQTAAQDEQLMVLQHQGDQLRRAQAAKPAPKITRVEQEEQRRWAALAAERSFTWQPMFAALEAVGNADVELLEFRPDKAGRVVMLEGEARDEASLIAFLDALSAQPALRNVHLTHKKIKKRDRLMTVSFAIKASLLADGASSKH